MLCYGQSVKIYRQVDHVDGNFVEQRFPWKDQKDAVYSGLGVLFNRNLL